MSAKLTELFPQLLVKDEESTTVANDVISKYTYHWPLFIVGIIITFFIGFIYLQATAPDFEINASILIKDKMKTSDVKSTLEELDITDVPKLAESEIEVLKSRRLILKVVNDLQLWVSYVKKDGLYKQEILTMRWYARFF
jgi:tyrosine-protein kinase Etk/Wzc